MRFRLTFLNLIGFLTLYSLFVSINAIEVEQGSIGLYHALPYLPINANILEAGAHNGEDTLRMAKNFPLGHIYAFEPVPDLFEKLRITTKSCDNVTCYPFALSETKGISTMFVSGGAGDASSSLYAPTGHSILHPHINFHEQVNVITTTIDSWAKENKIASIDLLWLDMQGGELAALKSAINILKKVRVIITEISFIQMYEGTPLYPEFKQWLEKQGFVVIREDRQYKDMGDALFVRKDLLNLSQNQ